MRPFGRAANSKRHSIEGEISKTLDSSTRENKYRVSDWMRTGVVLKGAVLHRCQKVFQPAKRLIFESRVELVKYQQRDPSLQPDIPRDVKCSREIMSFLKLG